MWLNPQIPADSVTLTEEILMEKFILCSEVVVSYPVTCNIIMHLKMGA